MKDVQYPTDLQEFINTSYKTLTAINKRELPIESIHHALKVINEGLKMMIKHRNDFLKEENVSVLNLSGIVHSTTLSEKGDVLIKVNDIIVHIKVANGVEIQNNFNSFDYSLNKVDNKQLICYAHEDDANLHRLVVQYKHVNSKYIYQVGNRIELNTYMGSYVITYIDDKEAIITCKKWQAEGKKPRKIKVSDIKGLASNTFNSLQEIKSKTVKL